MILKKNTLFPLLSFIVPLHAIVVTDLERLRKAYPDHIQEVYETHIAWKDGTHMPAGNYNSLKSGSEKLNNPELIDQVKDVHYITGVQENINPQDDPGRVRYEPFFRKMYGNSEDEVEKNLVEIRWMPKVFGKKRYKLMVTTVNGVNKKLKAISQELEKLVKQKLEYKVYLAKPGGTFKWRHIANTSRLSAHSFGMTIDINTDYSDYWQWDLEEKNISVAEDAPIAYKNRIPWDIVLIFEKHGFIWGGKWKHYDTMHFEYRPELLCR
jgi:hypothetical protein